MGVMTIAAYKPKAGKEADLMRIVKEHVPLLRDEGLVTGRIAHVMRAADGTLVEVFEWASTEAIERAHKNANVLSMWGRFNDACDIVKLVDLPESKTMFAGFTPVDF